MNRRIWHWGNVGALLAISFVVASSASARTLGNTPEATVVTGVSPTHAVVGQLVTISGTSLDGTRGVTFGTASATSVAVDPGGTWVRAVVPSSATPGSVYITLDLMGFSDKVGPITIDQGSMTPQANPQPVVPKKSTGAAVKTVVAPRINAFSPAAARVGARVLIQGANFVGAKWVKVGTTRMPFRVTSGTAILATVPKHARSGKLWVHTSGGTSSSSTRLKVVHGAA